MDDNYSIYPHTSFIASPSLPTLKESIWMSSNLPATENPAEFIRTSTGPNVTCDLTKKNHNFCTVIKENLQLKNINVDKKENHLAGNSIK